MPINEYDEYDIYNFHVKSYFSIKIKNSKWKLKINELILRKSMICLRSKNNANNAFFFFFVPFFFHFQNSRIERSRKKT